MAAVRRLLPQLTHLRHASGPTRVSTSVVGQTPPKVIDSTVKLTAIDFINGQRYALRGLVGQTLLKTLSKYELIEKESHLLEDVATCSGECEISVAGEWLEKLPPRSEAEMDVLTKTTVKGHDVDIHSRLSCQIVLNKKLDGTLELHEGAWEPVGSTPVPQSSILSVSSQLGWVWEPGGQIFGEQLGLNTSRKNAGGPIAGGTTVHVFLITTGGQIYAEELEFECSPENTGIRVDLVETFTRCPLQFS